MIGEAIANYRFVVIGERDDQRRWAIVATDDRQEAEAVLSSGRTVNGDR